MDLLADIFGDSPTASPQTATNKVPTSQHSLVSNSNSILDLLGDSAPAATTTPNVTSATAVSDLFAGLDNLSISTTASSLATQAHFQPSSQPPISSPTSNPPQRFQAYLKNGLQIHLHPIRDPTNPNIVNITVTFANDGSQGTISKVLFQAAVTKTQRLQMQPPSNTTITPGAEVTQIMRVANPNQTPLKFRLKISYVLDVTGLQFDDVVEFGGFPDGAF